MMHSFHSLFLVVFLGAAASLQASLTIDPFVDFGDADSDTTGFFFFESGFVDGVYTGAVIAAADSGAFGDRQITLERVLSPSTRPSRGTVSTTIGTDPVAPKGTLFVESGSRVSGVASFLYSNLSVSNLLPFDEVSLGFGPTDLADSESIAVSITVDDGVNSDTATQFLSGLDDPGTLGFSLASFTGVNLATVSSLELTIDFSSRSAFDGEFYDFQLRSGLNPIPEPGHFIAIITAGALALTIFRPRSRRNK